MGVAPKASTGLERDECRREIHGGELNREVPAEGLCCSLRDSRFGEAVQLRDGTLHAILHLLPPVHP